MMVGRAIGAKVMPGILSDFLGVSDCALNGLVKLRVLNCKII
jgi:hypothetical protein